MAYYITIRPPLRHPQALDALFSLLVSTNVIEAHRFAKQHPDHRRLLEHLIIAIHDEEPSQNRAQRALQLIGLPFSEDEELWFEECLLHGKAARSPGAKDSVLMRRLATGKLQSGTSGLKRFKGTKLNGVNWDDISSLATESHAGFGT